MSAIVLPPLVAEVGSTRNALQRVAVHVVARARQQATGRFGLRVTPGGFGTPAFGDDVTQVRVSGATLVVDRAGTGGASSTAANIDGATLRELAVLAGVDLDAELDVGEDTPDVGEPDLPLRIDGGAASLLAAWYGLVSAALDRVVAELGAGRTPTVAQLWPEHFDVALDLEAAPDERLNLGGSPGDGFHPGPYAYVGPWSANRPGDAAFWNAPFGATIGYQEVRDSDDPLAAVVEHYRTGIERFG